MSEAGIEEPNIRREIDKRAGDANKNGRTRAKISLSKLGLTDTHVETLISVLRMAPSIAKLDLSHNDLGNASMLVILKLLRGQMQKIKQVPVDKRLKANFLGEVLITKDSSISQETLFELQSRCDCLKHVNARSNIRDFTCPTAVQSSSTRLSSVLCGRTAAQHGGDLDQGGSGEIFGQEGLSYAEAGHAITGACVVENCFTSWRSGGGSR